VDKFTQAAGENPAYEMRRFLVLKLRVLFLKITELSHRDYYTLIFRNFRQELVAKAGFEHYLQKRKRTLTNYA
jgi:hypothetical protein